MYALSLRYAAEIERYAAEGHAALSGQERSRLYAWRGYIARTCADVVTRFFREAGANAVFAAHPLNRTFRDVQASTAHASLSPGDAFATYGRTLFGGPPHPSF